jgi:hypothetical protein
MALASGENIVAITSRPDAPPDMAVQGLDLHGDVNSRSSPRRRLPRQLFMAVESYVLHEPYRVIVARISDGKQERTTDGHRYTPIFMQP